MDKDSSDCYMYLVTLHYAHDDVPLYLSDDMDEALQLAENPAWRKSGVPFDKILELPEIRSLPISSSVTTFRDGVPCGRVIAKEFDDDDDDDDDDDALPEPGPSPLSGASV